MHQTASSISAVVEQSRQEILDVIETFYEDRSLPRADLICDWVDCTENLTPEKLERELRYSGLVEADIKALLNRLRLRNLFDIVTRNDFEPEKSEMEKRRVTGYFPGSGRPLLCWHHVWVVTSLIIFFALLIWGALHVSEAFETPRFVVIVLVAIVVVSLSLVGWSIRKILQYGSATRDHRLRNWRRVGVVTAVVINLVVVGSMLGLLYSQQLTSDLKELVITTKKGAGWQKLAREEFAARQELDRNRVLNEIASVKPTPPTPTPPPITTPVVIQRTASPPKPERRVTKVVVEKPRASQRRVYHLDPEVLKAYGYGK